MKPPPPPIVNTRTHCHDCGRKLEPVTHFDGYDENGEKEYSVWMTCPKFARHWWEWFFLIRLGHDCLERDGMGRIEWL